MLCRLEAARRAITCRWMMAQRQVIPQVMQASMHSQLLLSAAHHKRCSRGLSHGQGGPARGLQSSSRGLQEGPATHMVMSNNRLCMLSVITVFIACCRVHAQQRVMKAVTTMSVHSLLQGASGSGSAVELQLNCEVAWQTTATTAGCVRMSTPPKHEQHLLLGACSAGGEHDE